MTLKVLGFVLAAGVAVLLWAGCATGSIAKSRYCGGRGDREAFRERDIEIGDLRLHLHEAGSGDPPVVLVHGFGGTSFSWRHLVEPFARRHRVITFDLPGHGYSDKPKGYDYSALHIGELLLEVMDREGIRGAIVVGNSFGGAVAISAVLHAQDRGGREQGLVSRLVLIDSAGYPQKFPAHVGLLRVPVLKHVLPALVPPGLMVKLIVKSMYAEKERVEKDQLREYANALATPGTRRAFRGYARAILPDDVEELVKRYRDVAVPTLVIHGRKDKVVPLSVSERFEKDIPGARLHVIDDAGHIPQEETPKKVLAALSEFLGEDLSLAHP